MFKGQHFVILAMFFTLVVDTFCGHFFWTLLWTLFVDTFCDSLFVLFFIPFKQFLDPVLVVMLVSASVKRFSVSYMREYSECRSLSLQCLDIRLQLSYLLAQD